MSRAQSLNLTQATQLEQLNENTRAESSPGSNTKIFTFQYYFEESFTVIQ